MNTFHFNQSDLTQLLAKDTPDKLGDKVQTLIKKLKLVRTYKEQEVKELKLKEIAKKEILSMDNINQMVGISLWLCCFCRKRKLIIIRRERS